ncbi:MULTISPECIES: sensor histidine kinase [Sphaerochaeta]|uniref:Sensor histidine kinase n=1 Tax=Sphaerochaeta associata TaxID=1129264 RepID=A0ABY4DC58_9SPIR|nr:MULTISPECIES: sensor histidine kinase [Sphaerochaeta]MDT3359501.1 sensor histidine kinase [Spirochaetota bacterium]MDD2395518.1 sensor histidine kinase [Sphaerochaeta sp.]MDD3456789.1 sensor histidine kinase [Sphaerochaeta sp.]MDD4037676.1 sensor histidine kinase [Sphaerochaeta sp.]UOM50664.1 sensor histidine kinase [Sphaerochaeta associata]
MQRKRLSLQSKIFLMTMLVALLVMVISLVFIYRQVVVIIERNALQYMQGIIGNNASELDSMLEDSRGITLMVTMNPVIKEAATTSLVEASYEWFLQKKAVDSYLSNLVTNKEYISQLSVFSANGNVFQSGGSLLLKGQMMQPWMQAAFATLAPKLHYFAKEKRLVYTRTLFADKEPLALVVAELDYSYLSSKLFSFTSAEQLYLATYLNGQLLFDNKASAQQPISQSEIAAVLLGETDMESYTRENLMLVQDGQTEGISTIGIISYQVLLGDALRLRSTVILIILISLPLIFLASWLLTSRLYRNISELRKSMHEVGKGNLHVRSSVVSEDEIGEMAAVFNTMMDQIEDLLEQIKQTEKQKRESEFAILQSQIQPHFVYNTINSMKYYAHLKGVKEIEVVATAMVELLRAVLGQGDEFIPLSQEIHYIKQYLLIQRFKYQQEFETVWEIDEELLSHKIPKLLLQPIVENALIHGIANKKDGNITVKAYKLDDGIHITVTDNGKGIQKEHLDKLVAQVSKDMHYLSSVGISNVFSRIRMIYGEPYNGFITSFVNVGTVVELHIPL